MAKSDPIAIAARRARVADLILQRLPYRDIAALLDVSFATVAGDVEALRKEWAKSYGKADEMFERSVMDLDALQAEAMTTLQGLAGTDRLAAIDRVIKISDQRNRLLNLYPKPGSGDEQSIPTGPIDIKIEMIPAGNRALVNPEYQQTGEGDE